MDVEVNLSAVQDGQTVIIRGIGVMMMPSISISKGKGNFRHNTREQENSPINVDSERTKYNQTLVNRDIQQVYHELFDEPVTEYNALQVSKGHPERQINDYYKKILHDKKTKPFHELVIQVGRKGDDISLDVTNAIYHDFLREFEQNNPNLIVVGAYIHNDETTPHMHLDYVPVASYARGLKKRVANDRAIKSMNYRNWDTWRDAQMNLFEHVLNRHGLEREVMFNTEVHDPNVARFRAKAQEIDRLARAELEKIQVPEPEIRTNPITKKQTVVMSVDEYHNLTKKYELEKTSLEAQKSVLRAKLEKTEQKLENFKNKPYVASNELLKAENKKLKSENLRLIDKNKSLDKENNDWVVDGFYKQLKIDKLEQDKQLLTTENSKLKQLSDKYQRQISDLEKSTSIETVNQLRSEIERLKNLPHQIDVLKNENSALHERYIDAERSASAWKEKFEKLQTRFHELENQVVDLTKRIKNIAIGNDRIRAAIGYVKYFFSNETSKSILEATEKLIKQFAKVDGISEYITDEYYLHNDVLKNMPDIGYTFKNGKEGKGIYNKNNEMIVAMSSLKEARQLMPNVRIKDGIDRGIER